MGGPVGAGARGILARVMAALALACVLLAAAVLPSAATPEDAWADDSTVVASGVAYYSGSITNYSNPYNYWGWTLYESGELVANMCSSASSTQSWDSYKSQITSVELKAASSQRTFVFQGMFSDMPNLETVSISTKGWGSSVGKEAFSGCEKLSSVSISAPQSSSSVEIDAAAFKDCKNLQSVTLSAYYTLIYENAFSGCSSLSSFSAVSKNVSSHIYSSAFENCTALRTIDLTSFSGSIGSNAFKGCSKLKTVTLPASTSNSGYLGASCFQGCSSLESISIPSGVTSIQASTFEGCSRLKSATIPSTVTTIGSKAFQGCKALATATLPSALTSIGSYAFNGCAALAGTVSFPSTVTSIGSYAYQGSGIEKVTLPSSMTGLGAQAFYGATSLKSVTFPANLSLIGQSAFEGCTALSSIVLKDNVTTIKANGFAGCTALSRVRYKGDAPITDDTAFTGVNATCIYPAGNDTWDETTMVDYGGTLSWLPSSDLSLYKFKLGTTSYGYSGAPVGLDYTFTDLDGNEASLEGLTVAYYADEACTQAVSGTPQNAGTYYVRVEDRTTGKATAAAMFEITKAALTVTYAGETIEPGTRPALAISVEGFVGSETAATAVGYVAPSITAPATLRPHTTYHLTPSGAAATNYDITYVGGDLVVNPYTVEVPTVHGTQASTFFTYNGLTQIAVAEGTGYEISGTARAKDAGVYTVVLTPAEGYVWADSDDPDGERTFTWTIAKATVTATYAGETVEWNGTPVLAISYSGFANGENADSAADFVAPTISAPSTLVYDTATQLTPAGGSARNYDFRYVGGTLTVKARPIAIPTGAKGLVYTGSAQTGVVAGEGYTISRTYTATDAGTYYATVRLVTGYVWVDGSYTAKTITWSIDKADATLTPASSSMVVTWPTAGTTTVTYVGDGTVSVTSSDTSVATASYADGKLTVTPLKTGSITVTLHASEGANYFGADVQVAVTVKEYDLSTRYVSCSNKTYDGTVPTMKVRYFIFNTDPSYYTLHYYADEDCQNEITAEQAACVGTHYVVAVSALPGLVSGQTEAKEFTISKATLTATYAGETITHGGTPALKVTVTGFVNGETAATVAGYVAPTVRARSSLVGGHTYTLTPSGGAASNYTFTYVAGTLTVQCQKLTDPVVAEDLVYNGREQTGVTAGAHWRLVGDTSATDAGTYSVTATPETGYAWSNGTTASREVTWTIAAADISGAEVTAPATTYTGEAATPDVEVSLGGTKLEAGTDYQVVGYEDNVNAGTARIVVTGAGNYQGTASGTFDIKACSIAGAQIGGLGAQSYAGKAICPDITVTLGDVALVEGVDYAVTYADNTNAGTAKVTVKGIGNYEGSVSGTFAIERTSISGATVQVIAAKAYTGKAIEPAPTVKLGGKQLVAGVDYTLSYKNNIKAGTATVIVTGKGNCTGTVQQTFTIYYTITYALNGGKNSTSNPTRYDGTAAITLKDPTRAGYTFAGWYDASGKAVTQIAKGSTGNKTLTAKWTVRTYKITYKLGGGTNAKANPASYKVTSATITLKDPTRAGYTFAGWYDAGGNRVTKIAKGSTGSKTLTAKWTVKAYKITYKLGGGTNAKANPASYTVASATITLKDPTRAGYTFAGWYDAGGSRITKIAKGSTGDKVLTAKWTVRTYKITYKLNGGTNASSNPTSYKVTSATITLKNPTRSGYVFAGWYDANGNRVTKIYQGSTGSKTFTAKWSENAYAITYKLNGGTNNAKNPTSYTASTATITLKNPTRSGYTFKGWYDASGNKVTKIAKGSTGSKTFTAKWTKNATPAKTNAYTGFASKIYAQGSTSSSGCKYVGGSQSGKDGSVFYVQVERKSASSLRFTFLAIFNDGSKLLMYFTVSPSSANGVELAYGFFTSGSSVVSKGTTTLYRSSYTPGKSLALSYTIGGAYRTSSNKLATNAFQLAMAYWSALVGNYGYDMADFGFTSY